ncbi:hypothetical protein Ddc_08328 [Ditylenchus destructor]|nr:hypothetical protein Ddc_08328 [Ditylenchus destructor]
MLCIFATQLYNNDPKLCGYLTYLLKGRALRHAYTNLTLIITANLMPTYTIMSAKGIFEGLGTKLSSMRENGLAWLSVKDEVDIEGVWRWTENICRGRPVDCPTPTL